MSRAGSRLLLLMLPLALAAGCERAKSSNPLSPSVAGPIAGVSVEAPKPMAPAPAAQIAVDQQPITLTVGNASTTGVRPLSYIFEIAADAAFTNKLFTQTGVEPGSGGQTSLHLTQSLAADRTYYWRTKADDGANASDYSAVASFRVYTPVIIQAPALNSPADNATLTARRPTLVVTNSARTGPAGAMQYLFEASTDSAFGTKAISVLVNEGSGQTSYTGTDDLPYATRYYWRVKATDPGHESPYSAIRSFVSPSAPVVAPTPTPGPGPTPNPQAIDGINMAEASIQNSPAGLGTWPVTSAITRLELRPNGVHVEFSKQDGPNRWPDVFPPGWTEPLQYTLGMCMNISAQWYCSAVVQFWYGLDAAGGGPDGFANNWFYSPRWGPMYGHQPAVGETIGFFACAGDCRNNTSGSGSTVKERTNVVLIQMPSGNGGTFTF
jgi:hypothetical protein